METTIEDQKMVGDILIRTGDSYLIIINKNYSTELLVYKVLCEVILLGEIGESYKIWFLGLNSLYVI